MVIFRDNNINSQSFCRAYFLSSSGSTFKESVTLAANSNLYVENFSITFNTSGAATDSCYFSPVTNPVFKSGTVPTILGVLAIPR